ncbi:MAG: hypothetical protein IPG33_02050 [Betaproteobacteria bacterium]|nr:hypothetical protein [Betaproteobacteria bacterium]
MPTKQDLEAIRTPDWGDGFRLMWLHQSLSVPEAIRRIRLLDEEGLAWIEEPTRADDFAGHARIAQERKPVAVGENWWGPHDMAKSLAAGASDYAMPEAMKIGGVTGWLQAAALAQAAGTPVSSHTEEPPPCGDRSAGADENREWPCDHSVFSRNRHRVGRGCG